MQFSGHFIVNLQRKFCTRHRMSNQSKTKEGREAQLYHTKYTKH